ncbi:MAG: hypothetical protein MUC34_11210 [Anaerolineae bacterium]|nr:hypothetical protein [Anaerolineae bacterium]
MSNLTPSDKYGIAAAIALMLMVAINNAVVMLVLSLAGLVAGFWIVRRGEVRRVAFVAFAAFAIAAVFAVMGLVRAA